MPIRILIADDHTLLYDGLKAILEAQDDLKVIAYAKDGFTAVEQARELKPDVIIMDIAMPRLNGLSAVTQIKRHLPEIKIIILSMHMTTEHIYQALKAGANGYLVKESAGRELVEAVRLVIEGQSYLSQRVASELMKDYIILRETKAEQSPVDSLTDREREIVQLVAEGKTTAEIAEMLSLSTSTVDTYRSRAMKKLGVVGLPELVKFALQHGLTTY